MRASLDTHLLPCLYFTLILFSSFSALSSSASSTCQLQERFQVNSFHKAGDFVLGGLFHMHSDPVYSPEVNFVTNKLDWNCIEL